MSGPLVKPQLRNAGVRAWSYALSGSLIAGSVLAVFYKYRVLEPRKQHYKDFYDQWDDQKEYAAMKKAGIFKGFEPS